MKPFQVHSGVNEIDKLFIKLLSSSLNRKIFLVYAEVHYNIIDYNPSSSTTGSGSAGASGMSIRAVIILIVAS